MNPSSGTQVATLLFGGAMNARTKEYSPTKKEFAILRDEYEDLLAARGGAVPTETDVGFSVEYGTLERAAGERPAGAVSGDRLVFGRGEPDAAADEEQEGSKAKVKEEKVKVGLKHVKFELSSMGLEPPPGLTTKTGAVKTDAASLRAMAGQPFESPPMYGQAYKQFGEGEEGRRACEAIAALVGVGAIDTMLSNFILPLQENADTTSRIHCSLNLNTETGRLSSRAPKRTVSSLLYDFVSDPQHDREEHWEAIKEARAGTAEGPG